MMQALMFTDNGAQVAMRDRPDLRTECSRHFFA
jgi:hypothetical protein